MAENLYAAFVEKSIELLNLHSTLNRPTDLGIVGIVPAVVF